MSGFKKASKKAARLRLALMGPSGSGKTFTALRVGCALGAKVAVVDTERGSASKYADRFTFDVMELDNFHPDNFVRAINDASAAGYDVLVIDSLSHAWNGKDGALEQVDKAAARSKSKNSFDAWREVTPMQTALVDTILRARCHVIVTMRSKQEYVLETNERGKQVPRKVGMAPVQRDGMEYEFDVIGDMDESKLVVTKSRCPALAKAVVNEPGEEFAATLKAWLSDGEQAPEPMREPAPQTPAAKPGTGRAESKVTHLPVAGRETPFDRMVADAKAQGIEWGELAPRIRQVTGKTKKADITEEDAKNILATFKQPPADEFDASDLPPEPPPPVEADVPH